MNVFHRRLTNGLEMAIRQNDSVDLVSVQCWVGVGSLHETPEQRGMSHLLEHMLFKGTVKRGVGDIAKEVELMGGDINAYTSFDRTVYYLTLHPKHLENGIEILADAIFASAFDPEELEREKEVVIEEIKRAYDDPSFLLGTQSFSKIFAGSEAERPIFGSEESVRGFGREAILEFYKGWYQPSNLTMVVVGKVKQDECYEYIKKYFGRNNERAQLQHEPISIVPVQDVEVALRYGDFQQSRLEISFQGPSFHDEDSVHLDLAAYALGSGEASRLYRKIKDEKNLVSAVGTSCYTPGFAGVFNVAAFPLATTYLEAVEEITAELLRIKFEEPLTDLELERARANTKAEYWYQEETIEGQARSLGFGLTTAFKHKYDEVYLATINSLRLADTARAINKWFTEDRVVISAILPNGSSIDADAIKKAYLRGVKRAKSNATSMSASKKDMGSTKLSLHQLSSNLTLAYRRVEDSRFFTLCMAKEGGLRCEDESVAGIYNATATLMCRASTEISYEELLDINERYGSTMDGFSGKDSLGIRIQCLREHVDELLPVFFSTVFQPVFPTSLWRANQLEILDDIRTADDHPASVCYRELQKLIFGKHPYHMPQHGRHEVVAKFSEKRLEEFFTKERDRGRWVIGCVSNMDASEVEQLLAPYLQHWKISDEVDNQNHSMDILEQSENVRIDKAREQTHIALAVPGLNWTDPDRLALELLSAILTGQSGRLFINLRDRDSLAYTVTTMNSFGIDRGLFGAYMACAPEKAERALTALRNEFFGILSVPATAEELQRAKNGQIGGHASEMQRSNAQAMNMALMELYGVGYDELVKYTDAVEQITLADLQRVAARLLREDLVKCVVVG